MNPDRQPDSTRRLSLSLRLLVLVCLSLGSTSCAYHRFELQKENIADADAIVVPGIELTDEGEGNWILWNRMLMARLLYEEGRGERIVVTGGVPKAGVTEAQKMLEYGERLGIPRHVMVPEPKASSSVENGLFSAELLVARGYGSALVVTDRAHLIYSLPVFRDAYEAKGIELFWTPLDYERLEASGDWCPPGEATPPRAREVVGASAL